jgi:xylan 1,4-beta-xylosidase
MMTMARARHITGPYEIHPENPVLTSVDDPGNPIQRAGHGDIVDLPDGKVAVVYLASRPVDRHSVLGRETFIAQARWDRDGWLRMESRSPLIEVPDFNLPGFSPKVHPDHDPFDNVELFPYWNTLRRPSEHLIDLKSRPGWLLLKGTPSFLDSREDVALIARRLQHHCFSIETLLEYNPVYVEQLAGLTCYYDSRRFYWLAKQWENDVGDCLVLYAKGGKHTETEKLDVVPITRGLPVLLGADCDGRSLQFRYTVEDKDSWQSVGPAVPMHVLSDEEAEYGDPSPAFGFTGTMIGLAAYDITVFGQTAAFEYFDYHPRPDCWLEKLSSAGQAE